MATDGVTPNSAAYVPDKTSDDDISGSWRFTKPIATAGAHNWLRNGDFERWLNGTTVAPDEWSLSGAGASVAADRTNYRITATAAAITRAGTNCYLAQNIIDRTGVGPIAAWLVGWVSFGCWVRATVASRARLAIDDGIATSYSSYHTGGGSWEFLSVSRSLGGGGTSKIEARLIVDSGDTTAQFDGAILVRGRGIQEFAPDSPDGMAIPSPISFLFNGDFEIWGAGASAAPTGWSLNGAGAAAAKDSTNKRVSAASAQVTPGGGADGYLAQAIDTIQGFGPVARWQGRVASLGCWVRASTASKVRLAINDGVGTTSSPYHTGGGGWEWLQVRRLIDAAATKVEVRCVAEAGAAAAQFDGATFVQGYEARDYVPSGWRGRKSALPFGTTTQLAQNTSYALAPWGFVAIASEAQLTFLPPFKCIARNLRAFLDAAPAGGQTVAFTLRKNETTDTALVATVTDGGRSGVDVTNEVELVVTDFICLKVVLSATSGNRYCRATMEVEEIP